MSDDGYVHLPAAEMQRICLIHIISGIDEDVPAGATEAGVPTTITGYTEWTNNARPAISIGWDWQMHASQSDVFLQRVSPPRSNLMLQNTSRSDVGPAKTESLLEDIIDQLNWQTTTLNHICGRYRVSGG